MRVGVAPGNHTLTVSLALDVALVLRWGDLIPSGEPVTSTLPDVPFDVKHYNRGTPGNPGKCAAKKLWRNCGDRLGETEKDLRLVVVSPFAV